MQTAATAVESRQSDAWHVTARLACSLLVPAATTGLDIVRSRNSQKKSVTLREGTLGPDLRLAAEAKVAYESGQADYESGKAQ